MSSHQLYGRMAMSPHQLYGYWWSASRMEWSFFLGVGLCIATWMICYVIWLAHGCMLFLPFVSDFGIGPTGSLFTAGMTLSALMLLPTWFDIYVIARHSLRDASGFRLCVHRLIPISGVLCSVCIVGVAMNPWNLRLETHFMFADGVFFSSIAMTFLLAFIGGRSKRRACMPLTMASAAFVFCLLMFHYVGAGIAELGENSLKDNVELIRGDYTTFCTGVGQSFHAYRNINLGAFYEWLLLASVTGTSFLQAWQELQDYTASETCQSKC